jgi:hypothetical protein
MKKKKKTSQKKSDHSKKSNHQFAPTRRYWLEQVLLYLGALYSPLKDAFFVLRNQITAHPTPIRLAVTDHIQVRDSKPQVSFTVQLNFQASFLPQLIPGPHRGQVS